MQSFDQPLCVFTCVEVFFFVGKFFGFSIPLGLSWKNVGCCCKSVCWSWIPHAFKNCEELVAGKTKTACDLLFSGKFYCDVQGTMGEIFGHEYLPASESNPQVNHIKPTCHHGVIKALLSQDNCMIMPVWWSFLKHGNLTTGEVVQCWTTCSVSEFYS